MLSAGFCHLLADSLRQLSFIGHFPIATFLAASGYLLTLTADQLVQGLMDGADSSAHAASGASAYRPLTHASPPAASPSGSPPRTPSPAGLLRDRGRSLEQQQQQQQLSSQQQQQHQQHGHSQGHGHHLQRLHGGDDTKSPSDDGGLHEIPLVASGGGAPPPPPLSLGRSPRRGAPASPLKGARAHGFGANGGHAHLHHAHHRESSFEHVLELEAAVGAHNHFQVRGLLGRAASQWRLALTGAARPSLQDGAVPGKRRASLWAVPSRAARAASPNTAGPPPNLPQALLSNRRLSFATALLLAGALCVHSLLEGMALGAQPTLRGTEDIFLAIVAHKGLAAYALGASIVESRVRTRGREGGRVEAKVEAPIPAPLPARRPSRLGRPCATRENPAHQSLGAPRSWPTPRIRSTPLTTPPHTHCTQASNTKFWTTIGLFSAATPVGIFLGYAFAAHSGGVGAAVSALAAGTFVYVALMEVVPKELEDGRHRLAKMVSMLTGFGLMSLLAVWA